MSTSRDIEFGALTLRFTTDDGVPDGWYWLAHRDGAGDAWRVLVRGTDPTDDMVRPPVDWQPLVLGQSFVVDTWRPVPPAGYKIFSDVTIRTKKNPRDDPTFFQRFGCVREAPVKGFSYVHKADVVGPVVWRIVAPDYWYGTNGIRMRPSQFGGFCESKDKPVDQPPMHVLNLPIAVAPGPAPQQPRMDGYEQPVTDTDWVRARAIVVPFPGVKDAEKTTSWRVEHSPTYTLLREARYHLEKFVNNRNDDERQSVGYSVSTGISTSKSDSWHVTAGVSVTAKTGLSIGIESEISATVSVEAGYSSATNVTEMQERVDSAQLVVPARHSGAVYSVGHRLKALREDGTPVGGQNASLDFTPQQSYYFVGYPLSANEATDVGTLSRNATRDAELEALLDRISPELAD
ncbi:ETX/MTX2 family pore-forming toxin [Embleya sp. NPDC005971]|uniref:ETX/MTX2 family pore-forming toxin n=1 Tax=Embleya sp. NPDC005971 TaxID=3156724 RepID=UPI003404D8A5